MKIVKKQFIDDNRNYYDLSIEGTHNFCLADGEVVHNTGLGYSVQKHHVEQLPEIRKPNQDRGRRWLIADSIEGWADAVKVLVKSYFFGGSRILFDFSDIRPKGARLVTSGGKAPGPQPLKECLIKLEGILDAKKDGEKLTPIEVHDMICHIADAVLAGGIRRAALISLFSADDNDMIACKSGSWWESNPQRGRANNSAVLIRHKLEKEFFIDLWKKIEASGAGEPGIFLSNDKEWGTNPCITGDALVMVKDHSATEDGEVMSDGVIYEIPLKQLVDLYETSEYPPMVLSMNTETGEVEWDYMDAAALTRENADVIELELEDGSSLKLTPDHRVYTKNRGYIFAKDLMDDDVLVKIEKKIKTREIKIKKIKLAKNEDVYDITVRKNHNFFANGLLVHNCVEIGLRANQFCNLCEVNVSNLESQEDLNERVRAAAFIGTLQAGYTDFHYLRPVWQRTTEKDALIGVGMTGIGSGVIMKMDMKQAARIVKEENERVAKLININKAARTTCVKPSGCLVPETEIITNKGLLSLTEIFAINGYDVEDFYDSERLFLNVTDDLYVRDEKNEWQPITKLYVNGEEPTYRIEFEDGYVVNVTANHKFLTKDRGWVAAEFLTDEDDIVDYIVN